jgi:hypothetical protein
MNGILYTVLGGFLILYTILGGFLRLLIEIIGCQVCTISLMLELVISDMNKLT